jgi:hypothetical protein
MRRTGSNRSVTAGKPRHVGSIPEERDRFHLLSHSPIFPDLEAAQRSLVRATHEGEPKDWWARDRLDGALRERRPKWSKRQRHSAFDLIRERAVPGWLYKAAGRRSAYVLERFENEPSLPPEFRASAEELTRADSDRLRARILEEISMAVDDYRARSSRGPSLEDPRFAQERFQRGLTEVVEPYIRAVDSMLGRAGAMVPAELRWDPWLESRLISAGWWNPRANTEETHVPIAGIWASGEAHRFGFEWLLRVHDELETKAREGGPDPARDSG